MRDRGSSADCSILSNCPAWLVAVTIGFVGSCCAHAQDEAPPANAPAPPVRQQSIGQFITLRAPIDDGVYARVANTLLDLRTRATQEKREAYLVLSITPGVSPVHQVHGLARLLSSPDSQGVKTIAWVPESLTGPHALIALACNEIVMRPNAELGDLGRGAPLEPEDVQFALGLAQKRRNPRLNAAVVRALFDRDTQLWRIRTKEQRDAAGQTRIVARDELDALRQTNVAIEAAEVVRERGTSPVLRGETARSLDILVAHTADSKGDLAQIYWLPSEAMKESFADLDGRRVRLIKVQGPIDTVLENFLQRQMDRAVAEGAQILIFEIDSPGGLLVQSMNLAQAIAALDPTRVRTVAYVPSMALSGAAIVALGCDEIYLHPDAKFGDAGAIFAAGAEGKFERVPEKLLSPIRVGLQGLAEKKNRPVAVVEAMADRKLIVYQVTHRDNGNTWYMSEAEIHASNGEWIQGPQVRETNGELLLTVDGRRAHELKIAQSPVQDADQLKTRLGVPEAVRIVPVKQTWVDAMVFILNSPAVTVLLLVLGVALIYLELHFMTGLLGIGAALCFSLFFWSRFLGGTAGWLEVVLFLLGVGCLVLEFTVIPGFGVFGISGILLILASLVMAIQTIGNLEPSYDMRQLATALMMVIGALLGVMIFGLSMNQFLPRMPFYNLLVLSPPEALVPEMSGASVRAIIAGDDRLVGRRGKTLTVLRPSGKLDLDGDVLDVLSDSGYIAAGEVVEVISAKGNRIVVRQMV